ncbi:His-Xaa-Ser system radical SAM maturase HxsB [Eubacteriales bacterium SGI.150]
MKLNYFNFRPFKDKILLTNDFGDYLFVQPSEFQSIVANHLDSNSELARKLLAKRMAYEESDLAYSAENRFDLREIKGFLSSATSLHIFVVTTSCNVKCIYCQANNGSTCSHLTMDEETAERAVEIALQSPTKFLSFEFQGGEPLLNFNVIKHIVEYAEKNKGNHRIEYNVVSNLTLVTDEMLEFFAEYHFGISTSLDGPKAVHDRNRPFIDGTGTYKAVLTAIEKVRAAGLRVGAIETTTKHSLLYPEEIVRTYSELGFDSIFIRPLTPLGRASISWDGFGYSAEEFVEFYRRAINEVIRINKTGKFFKESHAAILLQRIRGMTVNYMELRSPCGAAVGQLAYYADGNIFTCDEARMLFEMGQDTFLLGSVYKNNYQDLVKSRVCRTVCASSILESIPSCCDCVYQPYCGTCPVVNYAMTQDLIEKQPRGYRCKVYSGILDCLFEMLLLNDEKTVEILMTWSD